MLPLLEIAYGIGFDERPDYNQIRFLLQKIQLDQNYLPELQFDWEMSSNESFKVVE